MSSGDLNRANSYPRVRVRFAPSPTGFLHVGGARTALFNYLFARSQAGDFILRIEDTDLDRNSQESLWMLLEDLLWLGLRWDEGPDPWRPGQNQGPVGPYFQSQRLEIYHQWAQWLLERSLAYYCFLTDAEIEAQKQEKLARGLPPHVESPYAQWSLEQAQEWLRHGKPAAIRFRTPREPKTYRLNDLIRGPVEFPSQMVGDFVIIRSDGTPVYNFCNVIDDHLMGVTHVLRAEEHLPNTLRQLMLYEALGWTPPQFGHLSLILDENRKKLSKRRGATSCFEFRLEGYLPQALNNFVALLGWSHPDGLEILTFSELEKAFSLGRVNPAPAQFDPQKLRWTNRQHLKMLSRSEFESAFKGYLEFLRQVFQVDDRLIPSRLQLWGQLSGSHPESQAWTFEQGMKILNELKAAHSVAPWWDLVFHIKESVDTLWDVVVASAFWCESGWKIHEPDWDAVTAWSSTRDLWELMRSQFLSGGDDEFVSESVFESWQNQWQQQLNLKGAKLFMPIRLVLTGRAQGLETKKAAAALPVGRIKKRLQHVFDRLEFRRG